MRLVYGRGNTSCPTAALSFPAMCQIFSRIKPENVIVEYVHTGLGYAGRPGGPIPTIRLRLTGLSYEFIALNSLMGLPAIAMSGLSATRPQRTSRENESGRSRERPPVSSRLRRPLPAVPASAHHPRRPPQPPRCPP